MMRGTITELIVGDHVNIRLESGETRRFPMQDVAYAGPAQTPVPTATAQQQQKPLPGQVHVHVVANKQHVELETRTAQTNLTGYVTGGGAFAGTANTYSSVCTAPCDTALPIGANSLALSYGGRAPIDAPVTLEGPSHLEAEYTSMRGLRIAGFVTFGVSLVAGITLVVIGATRKSTSCSFGYSSDSSGSFECQDMSDPDHTLIGVGSAVGLGGGLVGLVMALIQDSAQINVVPQPTTGKLRLLPAIHPRNEHGVANTPAQNEMGLTLRYEL